MVDQIVKDRDADASTASLTVGKESPFPILHETTIDLPERSLAHSATREEREAAFDELKEMLHDLADRLDAAPIQWKSRLLESMQGYQTALASNTEREQFHPVLQQFLSDYLDVMEKEFQTLHEYTVPADFETTEERDRAIALDTISVIKKISMHVEKDMELEQATVVKQEISINDLIDLYNQRLKNDGTDPFLLERDEDSIRIYSAQQDKWFSFPIPESGDLYHKGGFPRVLLKLHAGAPASTIEAELPPNDFDIVTLHGSKAAIDEATKLKIEAEGIESVKEFDFKNLLATRDVNLNSCFVGKDKLVFSTEAYQAAQSGVISLMASERGLFGSEFFVSDGLIMARNRGISRLMKFVAEGKATGFWFNNRNKQVEMGIYWNVLARKFGEKEKAGELCANLFELGVKGGQIDPDQHGSFYEVIDEAHTRYPFFDYHQGAQNEVGVAKWILGTKFCRQVEQLYRDQARVHKQNSLDITEGDSEPVIIKLDPSAERVFPNAQTHELQWDSLMQRCRDRTSRYTAENSSLAALKREVEMNWQNGLYESNS